MATKLYVGNLSFRTTSEELKEAFSAAGTVATVGVIAVAAVVIAAEIATNASRGGKKRYGKRGMGKNGNGAEPEAVGDIPSNSPFALFPSYFLADGVSFNFKRSLPRMISTSYS